MIQYLKVKNLALVDSLEIELGGGLTVVTGETGAGKSLLLGALSLLAGNKALATQIRQGCESAEVEAVLFFENAAKVNACLTALSLPVCEDGQLLLFRSIAPKHARVQINGKVATRSALETLGHIWIDFHGPGEPQKLLEDKQQAALLDAFAGVSSELADYQAVYFRQKTLIADRERLSNAQKLSPDELAFLQSQLMAFDALDLTPEGIETLERQAKQIASQQAILETSALADELLSGDNGIMALLNKLRKPAETLANIDRRFDFHERLDALTVEVEDIAQEYRSGAFTEIDNPEVILQRQDAWLSLQRQYGRGLDAVLLKKRAIEQQIASQTAIDGQIVALERAIVALMPAIQTTTAALTAKRTRAASDLSHRVTALLTSLGFKKADFRIAIQPADFGPLGNSHAAFLFAPNCGQDPLPLKYIASSGEMARVMLALKAILAKADETPVLVFDEVDANVGGEIGTIVGKELKHIGQTHQVFCVTHLPQVAAQGDTHLLIEKTHGDTDIRITLSLLDTPSARTLELARMLGDRSSSSALEHAKTLIA